MKKSKRKTGAKRSRSQNLLKIPSTKQGLKCRWKLIGRVTSAASEEPVTRGNLLSAIVIATTTTQVARIFMSCRVRCVRIWTIESTATNPIGIASAVNTPSVGWESDAGPLVKTISPQLGTEPGYVESYPPPDSFARFWSMTDINGTDVLFNYNAPAGSYIQIDMDCWINDSSITAYTGVSSGRTVGEVYYAIGSKITFLDMNN